jgi:hypothetical protein
MMWCTDVGRLWSAALRDQLGPQWSETWPGGMDGQGKMMLLFFLAIAMQVCQRMPEAFG